MNRSLALAAFLSLFACKPQPDCYHAWLEERQSWDDGDTMPARLTDRQLVEWTNVVCNADIEGDTCARFIDEFAMRMYVRDEVCGDE